MNHDNCAIIVYYLIKLCLHLDIRLAFFMYIFILIHSLLVYSNCTVEKCHWHQYVCLFGIWCKIRIVFHFHLLFQHHHYSHFVFLKKATYIQSNKRWSLESLIVSNRKNVDELCMPMVLRMWKENFMAVWC